MPLPPPSPQWPRFGCKFCPKSYTSRAQLNRHLDLYLPEFTQAYAVKPVTALINCHPLQVIRAMRSGSDRYKKQNKPRNIQWNDLTFSPFDEHLDLAVKLRDSDDLDAFQSRALVQAGDWIVALGNLHSPRKVVNKRKDEASDEDDEDDGDDEHEDEHDQHAASAVTIAGSKNSDRLTDAATRAKYGVVSRRLFSNLGSTKQLAEGSGSNLVSSKDKMSINCVSNDKFELETPPRRAVAKLPDLRRHLKHDPAFDDSDQETASPVVKGRKGKAKQVLRFVDATDSPAETPLIVRGSKNAPIVIVSDTSSAASTDDDGDDENDDDDEGISITHDAVQTPVKPPPTPRTRGAQFCTPGDDMPVVLWLSVKGEPGVNLPVRLGTTLPMAVDLLKRKLGEGVLAFEDHDGVGVQDGEWEEMMERGGDAIVDILWSV